MDDTTSMSRGGPAISRRRLLQVGGIAALGLGLPEFLLGRKASATGYGAARAEKSCIFIVQYGGAPHLDTLDMKPDAPQEIRGYYRPIATNVPGIQVSEMLPRLARLADRYCLIRSMTHGNGGHNDGMHVCLSGQSRGANDDDSPYFGSVLSKLRPSTRNIPSYVWVQNLAGDVGKRYESGGRLGAVYSPLRVGNDLDNPAAPGYRFQGFDPAPGLTVEHLQRRASLLEQVEPNARPRWQTERVANLREFQHRAMDLVTGSEARQAFDLAAEPEKVRDRYGRHPLGQNLLMARRLVESGVRLVSVTAWTGVPPGEQFKNVQTWDMHSVLYKGNDNIYGTSAYGLGWALPRLDQGVATLLEDLDERGLLDDTLVIMVGEFGRTPKFEAENKGRGHWPNAYTALLAGAGIRGGTVYGASDQQGAFVKDLPVKPEDFGATVYHALGVPASTRFRDDVPTPVSSGTPISQLF
jgi:uncharacterized protein (DUF1501 family)